MYLMLGVHVRGRVFHAMLCQARRAKEAKEQAAFVKNVTRGADASAVANARIAAKKRRDAARQRADLEEQIRAKHKVRSQWRCRVTTPEPDRYLSRTRPKRLSTSCLRCLVPIWKR